MRALGLFPLLASLLLASCGFLGADDFPGARLGSGTSPFKDLGPAPLCLGDFLTGPADSDPSGVCVPQTARTRASCGVDSDCRSRERCLCGRCIVQFCDGPLQCGDGRECGSRGVCARTCSGASSCPEGEFCDRGFCTSRCENNDECQTGETCNQSTKRCIARSCIVSTDCASSGEDCEIERNPAEVRKPSLLGDPLVLFFELRPTPSSGEIYRATTRDGGRSFTVDPSTPVLKPDPGERRLGAPSAIRRDGKVILYFDEPAGIGRAESGDDGRTFQRGTGPVLQADASGWEGGLIHSPGATQKPDGTVLLFYEGGDGAGIGLATAQDGAVFTKVASTPVLRPEDVVDPLLWRLVDRIGQPMSHAFRDPAGQEVISLWFSGRGVESAATRQTGAFIPPSANYSIGYAASVDGGIGLAPHPYNPVFDRVEQFLRHNEERAPTLLPVGDGYLMVYEGVEYGGRPTNLGIALNPGL